MPVQSLQALGSEELLSPLAYKQTLKCNCFKIAWLNRILAMGFLKKDQCQMAPNNALTVSTAWNTEVLASYFLSNLIIKINQARNLLTFKFVPFLLVFILISLISRLMLNISLQNFPCHLKSKNPFCLLTCRLLCALICLN